MPPRVPVPRRTPATLLVAGLSAAVQLTACSALGAPDAEQFQPASFAPVTARPATAPATKPATQPAKKPTTTKPEESGLPKGAVDWSKARTRLGRKATVCGPPTHAPTAELRHTTPQERPVCQRSA